MPARKTKEIYTLIDEVNPGKRRRPPSAESPNTPARPARRRPLLYPERDAEKLWQRAEEFRGGHHPDVSSQDVVSLVEGDLVESGDSNTVPEIVQRGIDGSIRCFAFDGEPGLALRRHRKINLPFVDVPGIMKSDAPTLLVLQGVFQF